MFFGAKSPMGIFQALILGLIQGISAWIPVSSKTQVLMWGTILFGLPFQKLISFAVIVHVGDLLAAIWLFRAEISQMLKIRPQPLADLKNYENLDGGKKNAYFMLITIICTGLVSVDAVGLGACLIRREVMEKIAKQAGDGPMFKFEFIGRNKVVGEDVFFCQKIREAGYEILVDLSLEIKHFGGFIDRNTYAKSQQG